jgi:G3E family GTPase
MSATQRPLDSKRSEQSRVVQDQRNSMDQASPRIPVTLLAGFLGSGKTTLVNRILSTDHGEHVAVIVNEFADAGIDGQLIEGQDVIELANGCICCTINTDLTDTLSSMLRRRERRFFRGPQFDRVLIEASGLASPGPTVQTIRAVEELANAYEVEGVVTLAHALHVEKQLNEHPEAAEQVGYADLLLLNHVDQADAAQLERSERVLRDCNGAARIVSTEKANVDVAMVLGTHARRYETWSLEEAASSKEAKHSSGVSTITLRTTRPLEYTRFKTWLGFLAGFRRHEILRSKGVLHCHPHEHAVTVQGIYQWTELRPTEREAPKESVFVIIGRDLDAEQIQRGWEASHLQ